MKAAGWLVIFVLAIFLPVLALADGMVIPQRAYSIPQIPDQQALIHYANGTETLVIETSFAGPGTNFAWIVPLPAVAKIEPVSSGLFPTLQVIFQPKVVLSVKHYWVALPLAALLIWIIAVIRRERVFGVLVIGLFFIFFLVTLGPLLSPAHSRGGISAADVGGVRVIRRQNAGLFDTVTIESKDPAALVDWLNENGYFAPTNIVPVLADYVRDGWVFAAARLNCELDEANPRATHPLAFRFKTTKPVYPLRLTAKGTSSCRVDLYVFGPGRAKAPGFTVKRCEAPDYAAGDSRLRLEAGELRIRHAELAKLVAQAPVATKLSASLDSDQMSHDAYIDWTGYELSGATVYSKGAALTISANAAALLFMVSFSVWWIVSSSKLLPSAKLHQFGHWLAPAAIGAGMIVYFLVVPKISIPSLRTVHLSFHALRNDALNLAQSLGDAISNPGASTVVSNAAAHVHTFSPQELDSLLLTIVKDFPQDNHSWWMHRPHALTNLFTGEPIRFEASPGNMILRPAPPGHPLVSIVTLGPAPGLYELVWHDLDGAEALTNSVPPWPPR